MTSSYKDKLKIKRKKKLFIKITFIFLGIVAVAGLSFYLLFFAELFDVRTVNTYGNEIVSGEEVLSLIENILSDTNFGLPLRLNVLFLNTDKISSQVLSFFPRLNFVKIEKKLFHKINVHLYEREIRGIWCFEKISGENGDEESVQRTQDLRPLGDTRDLQPVREYSGSDKCFYFDKEGIAFEKTTRSSGLILLHVDDYKNDAVSLLQKVIGGNWLEKIIQTQAELDKQLGIKTRIIIIPNESFNEFEVITGAHWKLLLDKDLDIPFQVGSLKIFLDQESAPQDLKSLQYIDARIENRFYYK